MLALSDELNALIAGKTVLDASLTAECQVIPGEPVRDADGRLWANDAPGDTTATLTVRYR